MLLAGSLNPQRTNLFVLIYEVVKVSQVLSIKAIVAISETSLLVFLEYY